jgi:hypothetical protein
MFDYLRLHMLTVPLLVIFAVVTGMSFPDSFLSFLAYGFLLIAVDLVTVLVLCVLVIPACFIPPLNQALQFFVKPGGGQSSAAYD